MVAALPASAVSRGAAAPPPNDNFSSATLVSAFPFSDLITVSFATTEPGEPFYCSYSSQTVWYRLTPATTLWFSVDTQASSLFGTGVNVYRDTGGGRSRLSLLGVRSIRV